MQINKAKLLSTILGLFVSLPIWYYLLYQVLVRVNASEIMWFLYWIYIPAGLLVATLSAIASVSSEGR